MSVYVNDQIEFHVLKQYDINDGVTATRSSLGVRVFCARLVRAATYLVLLDVRQVIVNGVQYRVHPLRYLVPRSVQVDSQQIGPATVLCCYANTFRSLCRFSDADPGHVLF